MLTVIQGGRTQVEQAEHRCKVLRSFAAKLEQRRLEEMEPSGPCCPWPCPYDAPIAA